MSVEQRKCPYCGMGMAADQRACPDCGNPYPFDDEPATNLPPPDPTRQGGMAGGPSPRQGRSPGGRTAGAAVGASGALAALAPYRTWLILGGVVVLIVLVAYLLFRIGMSYFESGRPDPSTTPAAATTPIVPPAILPSPAAGASPSPAAGTTIGPGASPSPAAAPGVRLKVANTEGQGANLRQRPSTTSPVLRTLPEGTVVEAIGGEQEAEDRKWRNVRDQGGATGWIASELLAPEE